MKKSFFSNYILPLVFLFLCFGKGWGQTFTQITTSGELTNGEYLIVGDGTGSFINNDGIMINTTGSGPIINFTPVLNPGSSITSGYTADNVFQITLDGANITIYHASVGYVSWGNTGTGTTNHAGFFNDTPTNNEKWTPAVSGGLWTLKNVATSTRILQWNQNNSQGRFAAYTTTQVKLKLYKKTTTTPTITLSPTTALNVGTTICEGSSGSGNYKVSASNLTADLILTPNNDDIEISDDESTWYNHTTPLSIAPTSGTVSERNIYVRTIATLPLGAFSRTIDHTSTDATTVTKTVTGTVIAPQTPTVSITPTTASVCLGEAVSFSATTGSLGGGTASYQWKLNGENVGSNSANYTLSSPSSGDQVSCVITVTDGCVSSTTATSSTVTVSVNALPGVPNTPAITTSCNGATASAVTSAEGTVYWQNNATDTSESLSASNPRNFTTTGTFYLRTKNTSGCWSAARTVNITFPQLTITTDVANVTATVGMNATFSVVSSNATGYQWQILTGTWTNIPGANASSYIVNSVTTAMNGNQYRVILTGTSPCTTLTSAVGTLTVVTESYPYNSYLSIQGSGSYTAASSWSRCLNTAGCFGTTDNAGGWGVNGANGTPGNSASIFVKGIITNNASNGAANVTILSSGNLIIENNYPVSNSVLVKSDGKLTINNNFNFNNTSTTFEVEDNADVIINHFYSNDPTPPIWNGAENFHPDSNLYIKNWDSRHYLVNNNVTPQTYNGKSAFFGNIFIDPGQDPNSNNGSYNNGIARGNWDMIGPLNPSPINFTHGNISFIKTPYNTSARNYRNIRLMGSESEAYVVNIYGNLNLTPTWSGTLIGATKANITTNIGGNVNIDSPGVLSIRNTATSGSTIMNIFGDLNMDGPGTTNSTILYLNQNLSNSVTNNKAILNLYGDFSLGVNSRISTNTLVEDGEFNFAGIGDGLTPATTQTINVINQSTASKINFNINSGAYVKLINQDLALGTNSTFTVKTGGTFDFGFSPSDIALNVTSNGSGQKFTLEDGGTLKITSPAGITATANLGNVQTPVAGRDFKAAGIYHYIGKTAQATGNGLPSTGVTGKVIVDLETSNSGQDNIDFTVTGTNYFATASGVNGTLDIRRGRVIDAPGAGFRNYNGTTDENQDGESDTHKGDVIMTGGRYVVSGGGTKPSLSGNYTLTGGTVEFAGTAASTKIRVKPIYHNLVSSGNTIASGGKNLTVNNLTTVTAGTLTIPESTDAETSYVLTAKKGLQNTGGTVIFGSGAQLMQDENSVNNSGQIQMKRKAKLPKMGYTYWSSPVVGQNVYNFSDGGGINGTPLNGFMTYREYNDTFTSTTLNASSVFEAGKGYAIRGMNSFSVDPNGYDIPASPHEFSFAGTIRNAEVTGVNVQWTNAAHGYNLIGNPYPSNISFDALHNLNSGRMYATAYFWTNQTMSVYNSTQQGSNYDGNNYAVYNMTGGNPATYVIDPNRPAASTLVPNGIIRVGQGFIVRAKNAGSLTINNTIRTSTGFSPFYNNKISKDRFWLTMTSPENIVNTILVGYIPGATNDVDLDYDAELFGLGSDAFYTKTGQINALIQGRQFPFDQKDAIAVGTKHAVSGQYTIALNEAEGIFAESQPIYIHDKSLNIYKNLQEGAYHFNTNAGQSQNRFEIVYLDKTTLGTDALAQNDFLIFRDGQDAVLKSKNVLGNIEIYDASGRLVKSAKFNSKEARINMSDLAQGFYIFKIENSGNVKTRKWLH